MTCGECKSEKAQEKTLYDKTLARRAQAPGNRGTRFAAGLLALGLVSAGGAAALTPAHAAEYGGFNTVATASPIKLEIFEPAIPIPTEPQLEFNLSYTRVIGDSGPTATARASALWPGPAIGEGLKTFGEQLGLPAALTGGGYPVQANAQYPSDTTQQVQEFFPGMVGRATTGAKRSISKVGYTGTDINDGDTGDGKAAATNPLEGLLGGDLGALTGLLTGVKSGNEDNPVDSNPLGALGLLIDFDGMASVSSTDYDGDTVTATATSRIGELRLLAGVIKLTGINVVTKVTSSLNGGAKTSQTVDIGGMTVAGQKFAYGPEGFEAMGKKTPIPGIPQSAADLLKQLGVSINVAPPEVKKDGLSGSINAEAASISIDTKPLRSLLPVLPLDELIGGLPDLPGQASLLKGLLLSLNTIAPKVVLHLGVAQVSAATVPAVDFGNPTNNPPPGSVPNTVVPPTTGGTVPDIGGSSGVPPIGGSSSPENNQPPIVTGDPPKVAKIAGLPALGSVPMLLILAGLALAAGIGWYLKQAGLMLFGGATACPHGFKAGIPDLRKV